MKSILDFLVNDNKVKQESITEFLVNKPITGNTKIQLIKFIKKFDTNEYCYMGLFKTVKDIDKLIDNNKYTNKQLDKLNYYKNLIKTDDRAIKKGLCICPIDNFNFAFNFIQDSYLSVNKEETNKSINYTEFNWNYWKQNNLKTY